MNTGVRKFVPSIILDFFMLTIGALIAAFAIEEFLVPSTILDGGVVGICIIINTLTGLTLGIMTFVMNIPFLIVGARKMGRMFIVKSVYAMAVFSLALEQFEMFADATEDELLAVCFGGVILGIGVGLVIRYGGCLDGTETVAILINKKTGFPVGRMVLIFNVVIYSVAGILFGADRAMYSLLTYFITSKMLDMIENGIDRVKEATIITNDANEVSRMIYERLGRTVTIMEGEGLVSGKKKVLMVVLTSFELRELKSIIDSIDASAFVTVSDVSEVIGNHIKSRKLIEQKAGPDTDGDTESETDAADEPGEIPGKQQP